MATPSSLQEVTATIFDQLSNNEVSKSALNTMEAHIIATYLLVRAQEAPHHRGIVWLICAIYEPFLPRLSAYIISTQDRGALWYFTFFLCVAEIVMYLLLLVLLPICAWKLWKAERETKRKERAALKAADTEKGDEKVEYTWEPYTD